METITPRKEYPNQLTRPEAVKKAEKLVLEILDSVHYGTTSLTHGLIKASRAGMPEASGYAALDLISAAVQETRAAWEIAIQQPEQKAAVRPKVEL